MLSHFDFFRIIIKATKFDHRLPTTNKFPIFIEGKNLMHLVFDLYLHI